MIPNPSHGHFVLLKQVPDPAPRAFGSRFQVEPFDEITKGQDTLRDRSKASRIVAIAIGGHSTNELIQSGLPPDSTP